VEISLQCGRFRKVRAHGRNVPDGTQARRNSSSAGTNARSPTQSRCATGRDAESDREDGGARTLEIGRHGASGISSAALYRERGGRPKFSLAPELTSESRYVGTRSQG
jgi:hypothetical protein